MKYFNEAVQFLKDINVKDEIIIVFNNDGDGISSCAILMKYLETTGKKKPYIISQPMPMDKNLVNRIKTALPNKIIFLDLVVDQQEDILKRVRGFSDILIVDHHQIIKNLNGNNVVMFNPRFTRPTIYQSTTYLVYKVCSELVDLSDYLWLAGIGIVSDYNLEDSTDTVEKIAKKYKIEVLYESFMGRIADMISATRATKMMSCEEMVPFFMRVVDPTKIEDEKDGDKLVKSYHIVEDELSSLLLDAQENCTKDGNIILYNAKSKYNLDSSLSTKLSEKHMDKLVIVYSKKGSRYKISARNQKKKINAGKVMKLASKGLKASGGGHEAAAGATVDEKDWEKFLKNVEELVNR